MDTVDVLVIGGGTAGTIAALQAGRAGARTLLIERGGQLGGMMTTGGVAYPGLFDAWGKQIIAGIGWELVKECVELDGGRFPDFSTPSARHWMHQLDLNPFLYAILAEEKCREADVEIACYMFPESVTPTSEGWRVDCVGFGIRRCVQCKQIVDCSGGAAVVGLLGYERQRGRQIQPGSMLFQLEDPYSPGRMQLDRLYISSADSSNAETVTAANLDGRKSVLAKVRETGKRLLYLQQEASFRESYRIVGETVITVDDYTSGRVFEDAVCYAFYPVDLHTDEGVNPQPLSEGVVPTIPLRALVPKKSRNLLVAGRSVSSDRLGNSGLRVQASCMAMGQAAGATAALSAKRGVTPLELPMQAIHALLRQHAAIVPEGVGC